jgi:hypothetical protein
MTETPIFEQLAKELFQNTGRRYESLTADGPIPLRTKAPEAVTEYVSMLPEERSSADQARYENAVERMPMLALMAAGKDVVDVPLIESYDVKPLSEKDVAQKQAGLAMAQKLFQERANNCTVLTTEQKRRVSLKKPRFEGPRPIGMVLDEMPEISPVLRVPEPDRTVSEMIDAFVSDVKHQFVLTHPNVAIVEHKTDPIPDNVVDRQLEFYKSALGSIGEDVPHSMYVSPDIWGTDDQE